LSNADHIKELTANMCCVRTLTSQVLVNLTLAYEVNSAQILVSFIVNETT